MKPIKILVAEDEETIREFIVINLKRAGYDVVEAFDGLDAYEKYKLEPDEISIAVLDIMMPRMDGLELCKKLRALSNNIGIMMLTAKTQEMDKVKGLMLGADDYVTKPFNPVEQLARELDIPREEVVLAMDAIVDPVSLYEPVYSDAGDNVCVMDQVRDNSNSDEHWLEQISLKDAIARLDKRQRNILALRFCQGKTQMEVSSEIGISQAQVSRLEKSAIACIKREM